MPGYPTGAIPITSFIGTTGAADTFATHQDFLGKGSHRTIDTIANRNLITTARRSFGMLVTVNADPTPANNKTYMLANTALGGTNNTITEVEDPIPDTLDSPIVDSDTDDAQ
jgi:hypothetical protein